jgi:hypothetical protein
MLNIGIFPAFEKIALLSFPGSNMATKAIQVILGIRIVSISSTVV